MGAANIPRPGDAPLAGPSQAARGPAVRVGPAPRGSLGPLARLAARVTARAGRGEPLRVVTTLARHRRLFRAWLWLGATLLRGDLPAVDRELVTLRTAWLCGSWYQWVQHAPLATRAGLDRGDVERVVAGPAADGWRPRQRLLLRAVDEMHGDRVIGDGTWRALADLLDERQLIELCMLVGHYEMLAITLNSLGVEPESSALAKLDGGAAAAAEQLREDLVAARRTG